MPDRSLYRFRASPRPLPVVGSTRGVAVRWLQVAATTLVVLALTPSVMQAQTDRSTGTLVVLNKGESTATFVDVASGETVATLPTGRGPHELAVTSDGRWAVSTDYGGGNSLTVFDVSGPEIVRTIDLGEYPRPHGAFFLPGDTLVAVTSEASRNVVLVDPFEGEVVSAIPTRAEGSHMVAVTGDGSTLYTGDIGEGTVSRLDVSAASKTRSYPVPSQPEAITVTSNGAEVWVGSNAEGFVSVLDTESGEVDTALDGFEWPYRILIVEEKGLVVIPDLRRNVVRFVDFEERQDIETLELPGEAPQGVAVTPDKETLFLSLSGSGQVAVIDLTSLEVVRRIDVGPTPDGIGWSPLVVER